MHTPSEHNDSPRFNAPTDAVRPSNGTTAIDSRTLFGSSEILHIEHHGNTYTLRKTRNGKLILTK